MRILIISPVYPPEYAPAGIMASELAQELARARHEVTVLTGFPSHPGGRLYPGWKARVLSREREAGNFALLRCIHSFAPRFGSLGKMWYHFTFAASSFFAALFKVRFDVLILQSAPAFCGPAAILVAGIKRARTFYWVHDIHPESAINAGILKEGILSAALKAVDSWVCRKANVWRRSRTRCGTFCWRGACLPIMSSCSDTGWMKTESGLQPGGTRGGRETASGLRPSSRCTPAQSDTSAEPVSS
jgi:hypothetical protein